MPLTKKLLGALVIGLMTIGISASATPIAGLGTWETTLSGRDLDGNGSVDAIYDSTLDVTWLKNANLSRSSRLGISGVPTEAGTELVQFTVIDPANTTEIIDLQITIMPVTGC